MNRTARTARQIVKARAAQTRLIASCKRRPRSLATHVIALGVPEEDRAGLTNGLRTVAKRLKVQGIAATTRRTSEGGRSTGTRPVQHFTRAQIAVLFAAYRPRKGAYVAAKAAFLTAA